MMDSRPADLLPFEHLIEHLGRQGVRTGVESYVRMRALLSRIGGDCSPGDLKTLLCPLFATNAEQQEAFYRTFDACYPFLRGDAAGTAPGSELAATTSERISTATSRRPPYVVAGVVAIALVIALAVWNIPWRGNAPAASAPPLTGDQSPPESGAVRVPRPRSRWIDWYAARRTELTVIAMSGPLVLWVAWELYRFRRRRLVIRRSHGKTPPYSWPMRADGTPEIYEPHELAAVSRLLHRRHHAESQRFDVTATVAASVAALGFPRFRYRHDSRLPEYLFLIDRVGFRDHQSHLYEHLATMLRAHGLHVSLWFFEGDPRVCWSQSGDESVYLEQLQRTTQDHRVLLFGTGEQVLDPVTGLLAAWHPVFEGWADRAILTPEPVSRWAARELTLALQFAVVPATLEGLALLAAYFELPQSAGRRPPSEETTVDAPLASADIDALQRYLGADVFQWLCACAIYPELQWSLTLSLGALPTMPPGLVCEETLVRLLPLEWFRSGSIPDDQRRALIAHLDPRIEREVREAIVGVLEHTPFPEGTFAASAQRFQIAYQRSRLAPKDRKVRRALRAALRNVPPGEIVSDCAYLDAAESLSRSPLQLVLPQRLRRLFYPAGVPWMGMRSTVRLMLALAVTAGALQGLRAADRRLLGTDAAAESRPPSPTPPQTEPARDRLKPEAAISDLLVRYEAALEARDLPALKLLWPELSGPQERSMRIEFEHVERIDVQITDPRITVTGRAGTATFNRRYEVIMNGKPARIDSFVTLYAHDTGAGWVIERIRFEPVR